MQPNMIFSPADFYLPPYAPNAPEWSSWAVIACDQFTSEPEYWQNAAQIAKNTPSALHLILPEAYLGTPKENAHKEHIRDAMSQLDHTLTRYDDSLLYLERTLPDGRIRRGIVGKMDLEAYDYNAGSASPIRATEATVLERIPPRVAIRRASDYELPHVMVLFSDSDGIFDTLRESKANYTRLYDFDLMLGGGHAVGYRLTGDALTPILKKLSAYESAHAGKLVYAVGDGNHSLAAAKAHYTALKDTLGEAALMHPARYALVELVALEDSALDFEPIYRVVSGCDVEDFLAALSRVTAPGDGGTQQIHLITAEREYALSFTAPTHALTVGSLQNFIDDYIHTHPDVKCDYIHDKDSLLSLAKRDGCIGFLFDGMKKEELFPYVRAHGTLPRKTFSMGEARSKRYYIEARRIAL